MKVDIDNYKVDLTKEVTEISQRIKNFLHNQINKLTEKYEEETNCDEGNNNKISLDMANGYMDICLKPLLVNLMFFIVHNAKKIADDEDEFLKLKNHVIEKVIESIKETSDSVSNDHFECDHDHEKSSKKELLKKIKELLKDSGVNATMISL